MRADPGKYVRRHVDRGHVGKEPGNPAPGTLPAIKAERHRKSVDERIDAIFDEAMEMAKLAKADRDYRTAASCLREATSATALMGKPTEGTSQLQQTINIDFSKLSDDELKTYATLGRKLEGSGEGTGSEKAA